MRFGFRCVVATFERRLRLIWIMTGQVVELSLELGRVSGGQGVFRTPVVSKHRSYDVSRFFFFRGAPGWGFVGYRMPDLGGSG